MTANQPIDAFDLLCDLERQLYETRAASLVLETLCQHHFDGKMDADGYRRLVLNEDEIAALMHALYHTGDEIKAAQAAFDRARGVIIPAPAEAV
jgi:hypothetical protein